MSKFDKLASKNLFWTLQSAKLPPNIRDFSCDFVIDEFQSDGHFPNQRMYLRFTHPQHKPFEIMIDEFYPPNSAIYDAQINISKDLQEPITTLNSQFEAICFTNIRNYLPHQPKVMDVEVNENSAYSSDDQICHSIELDSDQYYSEQDDYSVADYSSQNEAQVKQRVLFFYKNPANKNKKIKELKAYLKNHKFNVPDSHLKVIVNTLCGQYDKKKGFQVLPEYLSYDEKKQRMLEEEKEERQEREKEIKKNQKKKSTKKETKTDKPGRITQQISISEVEETKNQLLNNDFKTSINMKESKPSNNKKDSKKHDSSLPKTNKKSKGK